MTFNNPTKQSMDYLKVDNAVLIAVEIRRPLFVWKVVSSYIFHLLVDFHNDSPIIGNLGLTLNGVSFFNRVILNLEEFWGKTF